MKHEHEKKKCLSKRQNVCLKKFHLGKRSKLTATVNCCRRKTNETMTVQTMCHNPILPLEGVDPALLLNFTSRECHMSSQPTEEGAMMVCGCQGEHECNDKLIFDKGANGESMDG